MYGLRLLWDQWRGQSASRRIFAALVTVCSVTTVVKLAGAAKVILIARYFGVSDALDAFLIAFLIPSFLADVVAGATSSALIPVFVEVRERQGHAAARRVLSTILLCCLALCMVLAAGAALASGSLVRLVGSGFDAAKLELTRSLLLLLCPVVLLSGTGAVWRAVLNALDRFALPAAAPGLTPLATILAVVVGAERYGAYALAAGTLAGSLLEVGVIAWRLIRSGLSPFPWWYGWEPPVRQVIGQYWPMVASALVFAGSAFVDQSMAAMLGPGSVSALSYGNKVLNVILAVGPAALGTAALPHFSLMVARGEWDGLRNTLRDYRRLIFVAATPLTLLLVWLSAPLVRLLFEGGAFSAADTPVVVRVQQLYLLQAPFALLAVMMARLISALQANQLLLRASAAALMANVVLNYVLMRWLGVAGIALATSLVTFVYYCYLARMVFGMERGDGRLSRTASHVVNGESLQRR